ncbi:hypothetical protein O3P69_012212 [Scylla paramamosain]|uniref:Uncharacterized protein n=1 Tax=Scylla paramamosain TaxID=85552 RepID=A0AAW0TD31_SCYPA
MSPKTRRDKSSRSSRGCKDLSTDQHYAYRVTKAVRCGEMDKDLAALTVGKTGHSRWLTTANLFCDWWCRKHGLQGKFLAGLRKIMSFIAHVYFPCWFHVKINHSWVDDPRNVLFELSCLRTQPNEVQLTHVNRPVLCMVRSLRGDPDDNALQRGGGGEEVRCPQDHLHQG